MFNSLRAEYKTPFGAVAAGEEMRLRFTLPPQDGRTPSFLLYRAGEPHPFCRAEMQKEEDGFTLRYAPQQPGLYYYCFMLSDGALLHRAPDGSADYGDGPLWQLTVYKKPYEIPRGFAGRVMYQIFPDRYYKGGGEKQNVPADRQLHSRWDEEPKCRPDADGVYRCNDYFGGDLAGISEKLEEILALGAEILYLNPIFEAHSNHRYNTADYLRIDPLLGTEQDFTALCQKAHRLGMKIILDGVFNHTGSDSVYFNREGRYGSGGAWRDPHSPYRDWYCWKNAAANDYESWWGFATLPKLNSRSQSWREFLCGENGVVRHWLRLGADGWRLDVVDEYPDELVRLIRQAARAEKPDALILGEVWEDASCKEAYGEQRQYLMGDELDSAMNYPLRQAILDFLLKGDGTAFRLRLLELLEHYPRPCWDVMMNLLSSHDVPRAVTVLGGLPMEHHDRDWQREHNTLTVAQYYRGRQLFMLGTLMCMTLPGMPSLYYGDEAGLVGYADPFNRGTYPWGREDTGLRECIRQMALLRGSHPSLSGGEIEPIACAAGLAAWRRYSEEEETVICVNPGDQPATLPDAARGETLFTVGKLWERRLEGQSAVILRTR